MSYVAEVVLVDVRRPPDVEAHRREQTVAVLYCDNCHRWGRPGTTHLCGATWSQSLTDLLLALIAERT